MIVSTRGLAQILRFTASKSKVVFSINRYKRGENGSLYVNDIAIGEAMDNTSNRWENFSVPYAQAMRLYNVLQQLDEQPITLSWNEGQFTLDNVIV